LEILEKIDLVYRYHNIRIKEDGEKDFSFLTPMWYYLIFIMQQGDYNNPTIIVLVIYEIFNDIIFNDLVMYINDIIIFSNTYF